MVIIAPDSALESALAELLCCSRSAHCHQACGSHSDTNGLLVTGRHRNVHVCVVLAFQIYKSKMSSTKLMLSGLAGARLVKAGFGTW